MRPDKVQTEESIGLNHMETVGPLLRIVLVMGTGVGGIRNE